MNNATTLVLVRAKFVYKNYDGLGKPPRFSVSIGTAIAATINLAEHDPWNEELLWTVNKDTLPFCLISIPKGGSPVISSLEIRPLPQGAYTSGIEDFPNKLLRKTYRIDCGYTNDSIRYPLDPFDRIWDADRNFTPLHVAIGFKSQHSFNQFSLLEEPPAAVIQTGRVLARRNMLTYNLPLSTLGDYYIILYFAGILPVFPSFDVLINGDLVKSTYTIKNSEISVLYVTQKGISSLNITLKRISFYPLINAFEGFAQHIAFRNLENNKLQGPLPQSLKKETLEIRASGNLCLTFSTTKCDDASSNHSIETPQVTLVPKKKHNVLNHLAIVLGIGGATVAFLLMCVSVFIYKTKQKYKVSQTTREEMDMRNWGAAKVFSYKEIKLATRNFKEVIGRGSFGSVYLGKLPDGKSVAIKVRFDKSQLGADSFINEVNLLSKIRHQNLVSLEGFCHESKHQILVYEYLPGGPLADHLYGTISQKTSLSWVRRLKIAVDAAKALDYLHNGSEPRIIHRDIKCSNILLDRDMNAKVCDLGLSKQVTHADATHVTTIVKGTAGYLDPEYYSTQQLTEKSDVYSFGVVLLELICGREPLTHSGNPDSFNLVLWAKPYLQAGAFEIVDEDIKGTFDPLSMKKATFIAIKSVERDASQRPSIAEVLAELKEAYSIQLRFLESCQNEN
ncbi:Serine/threonine-protein kinase, active site [Sesbania bispinosa]|nr:Serine/threonine-protein kinase, active site [Sesbania bispinosa]